ncbi:MAG: PEP-CTERM sorting domain-containing protein, partial [Armatimonadota bacterium]
ARYAALARPAIERYHQPEEAARLRAFLTNRDLWGYGFNNDLFVSSALTNQVLRYNGTTGASMGVFASGGGMSNPTDLIFRPDGNLYALSAVSNQVLRYSSTTGAFVDAFAQGGGLNIGLGMLFDSSGNILVGSNQSNQILKYSGANGAFQQVFASNASLVGPNGMTYLPVPEPATVLSLATLSICLIRRRKKSKI